MENQTTTMLKIGGSLLLVLIAVSALGGSGAGIWIILGGGALLYWVGTMKGRRRKRNERKKQETLEAILGKFGQTREERAANLNKAFDEKMGTIDYKVDVLAEFGSWWIIAPIGRSLASMSPREREALRAALLVYNEQAHVSIYNTAGQVYGLVFGEGKATIFEGSKVRGLEKSNKEALKWLAHGDGVDASVDLVLRELQSAIKNHPENPVIRALGTRLLGDGADMAPTGALQPLADITQIDGALIIGEDESDGGKLWTFKGEGSLITIAPPGSGKTQCHVIPNLLTWTGPAVVLDIKGEIYAATAEWRRANVGPVFRFSPLDTDNKHSYNPLLAVSDNDDHIWEDSRFLADMLIVPGGKAKDPFWESRARDVLTAAIANTVLHKPPAERTMGAVLDVLHGIGWDNFLISLQATANVPSMVRAGKSLGEMEAKLRDSVLQTGLASLSAWEGARIARATAKSDWSPADLRSDAKPTIYICIKPNEIDSYASMLRVIVAQHIRALTSTLPEREAAPILFFLDELPRLRHMPPIEEALEIGRQYGIKLWMFAQGLGQLKTAYENADGMVASCALRMFMNPSTADGTAQKLSDEMGFRESVIDGTRVKRVEPNVLAGPEFADKIIVMASSGEPARLKKHQAHADAELARRMGKTPAAESAEVANG